MKKCIYENLGYSKEETEVFLWILVNTRFLNV